MTVLTWPLILRLHQKPYNFHQKKKKSIEMTFDFWLLFIKKTEAFSRLFIPFIYFCICANSIEGVILFTLFRIFLICNLFFSGLFLQAICSVGSQGWLLNSQAWIYHGNFLVFSKFGNFNRILLILSTIFFLNY